MLMQSFIVAKLHSVMSRYCFHLMAGSSPMHGRDWFLLEVVLVNTSDCVFDAMQRLRKFAQKLMGSNDSDTKPSEVEKSQLERTEKMLSSNYDTYTHSNSNGIGIT